MPIAAVVGDSNVLLSAAIGKAAQKVITDHGVRVHTTQFNVEEVEGYLPRLAAKYELPEHLVQLRWRLLGLHIHRLATYREALPWARKELEWRDPDDVHPLALARALKLPLWSNDRDFETVDIEVLPTARLLAKLEKSSP